MAAAQAEFSPWTGIKPGTPQMEAVDPAGAALTGAAQGGLSGMMMNKQFKTPDTTPKSDFKMEPQQSIYGDNQFDYNMLPGQRRT